jgi:hypothetical protein
MKAVLKQIAPHLRALGFRGSGQNYRRTDGDFVFIVNFQGSSSGDSFYVNLGAQPVFIPNDGYVELKDLKEHCCVFRQRVGGTWPWDMPAHGFDAFAHELTISQAAFFGHIQTLPNAIATRLPEELLAEFTFGQTEAGSALHLARAAVALGQEGKGRSLARAGLDLASGASILISRLREIAGTEA